MAAGIVVVVVVMLLVIAVSTAALVVAIRYFGKVQQQAYDADVQRAIASTQPDAAFLQREAEIDRNLADADALVARLEAEEAAAPPAPPAPPVPPREDPPPDPTI